jgi:hypothetical protein
MNTIRRKIAWKSQSSITQKKSERKDLMKHLLQRLEEDADIHKKGQAREAAKKSKESKIPEIGD